MPQRWNEQRDMRRDWNGGADPSEALFQRSDAPPTPPPITPPTAPSDGHTLLESYGCRRCDYDLKGLTLGHRCPECGEPVARSVFPEWIGELGVERLEQIASGLRLSSIGLATSLVVVLVSAVGAGIGAALNAASGTANSSALADAVSMVTNAITLLVTIVFISCHTVGWLRVTQSPRRDVFTDAGSTASTSIVLDSSGRFVRPAVIALAIVYGASMLATFASNLWFSGNPTPNQLSVVVPLAITVLGFGVLTVVVVGVCAFGTMRHCTLLAERAVGVDRRVLRFLRTQVWLTPVLQTAGVLLCGLGPFAAIVLQLIAQMKTRRAVMDVFRRLGPEA